MPPKIPSAAWRGQRPTSARSGALVPVRLGPLSLVSADIETKLDLPEPQSIACGSTHTLCLGRAADRQGSSEGPQAFGWGGNRHNQLGVSKDEGEHAASHASRSIFEASSEVLAQSKHLEGIFEVACGNNHSVVLVKKKVEAAEDKMLSDSAVYSYGLNANGQLGVLDPGEAAGEGEPPGACRVRFNLPKSMSHNQRAVVQRICCGSDHTLAVVNFVGQHASVAQATGRVFSWGLGSYGALGIGSEADCFTPREVWFPRDIREEAEEYDGSRTSERVTQIKQVACGTKHSMALSQDGVLYSWGHGGNGRLGISKGTGAYGQWDQPNYSAEFEPKEILSLKDTPITYIACGEAHSAAVDQLGGLHTWGSGANGRLGHGTTIEAGMPIKVQSLGGVAMRQVACGLMHSVATTAHGLLYSWGKGAATGLDSSSVCSTPRLLELPEHQRDAVYQIAAGMLHTLVLLTNGTLFCFGSGSETRLPWDNKALVRDQAFPRKLEKWKGRAQADDDNPPSENGRDDSDSEERNEPSRIMCGGRNSAVLLEAKADSTYNLWVWGASGLTSKTEGRENLEEGAREKDPVTVPGLLKRGLRGHVKTIAMGHEHCLAITFDSLLYSWGSGTEGQLGTGTLRDVPYPQQLHHPTDVIDIAAGEAHSACIIRGGKSFTWGNADGGRLGLGGTFSEGVQLMPKQVVIDDAQGGANTQSMLLRSVSCGSQHTALVNQDDGLLTFGTGWYGKLGQGSQDNCYLPRFVPVKGLQVRDVYCAAYHTCIVDKQGMLWLCGRNSSVCRDGGNHLLVPELFGPFANEPKRRVRSLATSEQHTLVVTQVEGETWATEIWVWGKNNSGQLGLPPYVAPRIDKPWLMQIPDLAAKQARINIKQVQTASGHSLLLLERMRRDRTDTLVYAWGSSSEGRLGLEAKADDDLMKLEQEGFLPYSVDTEGPKVARTYPPMRVQSAWRSKEPRRKARAEGGGGGGGGAGAAQERNAIAEGPRQVREVSTTWLNIQWKLHQEDPEQKTKKLLEQEAKVSQLYMDFVRELEKLWDKPAPGVSAHKFTYGGGLTGETERTEFHLRKKERELETEYIRTLKAFNFGRTGYAPKLEGRSKTDPELTEKLHLLERLIWVLQQQPLYMGNLAKRLLGMKKEEHDAEVFHRMAARIYNDLRSARGLNLFKALLRLVMQSEIEAAREIEDLFDPVRSRAAGLFTQLCTNPVFLKDLVMPIMDPDLDRPEGQSLVSIIIDYTVGEYYKAKDPSSGDLNGVFCTHQREFEVLTEECRRAEGRSVEEAERKQWRQKFIEMLRKFLALVAGSGKSTEKEKEQAPIADFVRRYIEVALREGTMSRHICMLWGCVWRHVMRMPYVIKHKKEDALNEMAWEPGICTPIASLLLEMLIGGVLHAIGTGPFALLNLKIREKIRERIQKVAEEKLSKQRANRQVENREEAEFKQLVERVFWNIHALANFLQRVVHKGMFEVQLHDFLQEHPQAEGNKGDDEQKQEEAETKKCFHDLLQHTNKWLLNALLPEKKDAPADRIFEDVTETQLAVDLYTSHYTLRKSQVSMPTDLLLEMTNLLWRFTEREGDQIYLNPKDELVQLLQDILPRKAKQRETEAGREGGKVVPWSKDGHIWLAQQHGEWHNFTMQARFLEFAEQKDASICLVSQAPVPRFLTIDAQRQEKGFRPLKAFQPPSVDQGPEYGSRGIDMGVFQKVAELIEEISGNKTEHRGQIPFQIFGRTFLDLKNHFEDFQRRLARDIEEGRAAITQNRLLKELDLAKQWIDKIKDTSDEKVFFSFMDSAVRRRSEYHYYVDRMERGVKDIERVINNYWHDLDEQYRQLFAVVDAARNCDLPAEILTRAQRHSESLAFSKAKRIKSRALRHNPTPAQKKYEALMSMNTEGRSADELREQVSMPPRTFRLKELEEKGIVLRVSDQLRRDARVLKGMRFTFQWDPVLEGFRVKVNFQSTELKDFAITRQEVRLMEEGLKMGRVPYPGNQEGVERQDAFIWVRCHRLRRLIAWMIAEGGL